MARRQSPLATLLFVALALALGAALFLAVEDALVRSLRAPAWAAALWRALCYAAGGFLLAVARELGDGEEGAEGGAEGGASGEGAAAAAASAPRPRAASAARARRRRGGAAAAAAAASSEAPRRAPAAAATAAGGSGTGAEPAHVSAALRAMTRRRLRDGYDGGGPAICFSPERHVLAHPFEAVLAALKNKFRPPRDPLNPSIREVKLLSEATSEGAAADARGGLPAGAEAGLDADAGDGGDGDARPLGAAAGDPVSFMQRDLVIGMKEAGLPAAITWYMKDVVILETTLAAHAQRCALVTLRTRDAPGGLGRLLDQGLYFADPADAARTVFVQVMDIQATSVLAAGLVNGLKPAAGQPAKGPPAALAGPHLAALEGRLREMFG
jgi:hypothetical protein